MWPDAGVFSMDGHIAPLPDICALARKYGALVFVVRAPIAARKVSVCSPELRACQAARGLLREHASSAGSWRAGLRAHLAPALSRVLC